MLRRRCALALMLSAWVGLAACSSGSDGGASGDQSADARAERAVRSYVASQPPRALEPFPVGQTIGLGDWEMLVRSATRGPEVRVELDLVNATPRPARVERADLFSLRDGIGGPDVRAELVTGLEGPLTAGAAAPTTIVFRLPSAIAQPVLIFHGDKVGSITAAVDLSVSADAVVPGD